MQSHRVRIPTIDALIDSIDWISRPDVSIAHFGGGPLTATHRSIAIGPEGGWSEAETAAADARIVSLGSTVLRSETAAIAAGTLLSALNGVG
jgi:16S rRNA (uracil1498-N3)-methyltransferase